MSGTHSVVDNSPSGLVQPVGEFEALAQATGQNLSALRQGQVQKSRLRPEDIHALKKVLCREPCVPVPDTVSHTVSQKARSRLWQGVHDRGEDFIFMDLPLAPGDLELMTEHFPARLQIISIPQLSLARGEVLDVTSHAEEWQVGEREELYTVLNIDRCQLASGAVIKVHGNVLSLVMQELNVEPNPVGRIRADNAHIAILPTLFPVDSSMTGPIDGPDGANGAPGVNGHDGEHCRVMGTTLGPILKARPPVEKLSGGSGTHGDDGGDGRKGRTGGMSKRAHITIRRFAESSGVLRVYAKTGDGGHGGNGGRGGDGGHGGRGGSGAPQLDPPIAAGLPGQGGDGGRGGNGGNGGRGGISSVVHISCPPRFEALVDTLAENGKGGKPGCAGMGGAPGLCGEASTADASAQPGKAGVNGEPGRAGRSRPAPAMYVNWKRTNSTE